MALGEVQRNTHGKRWQEYRFAEIWAQLETVLDCRDLTLLGLSENALLDDMDYSAGHALGAAAVELGVEGMLVSSATRPGDNSIVFPHQVRSGSILVVVRSVDPRLVKGTSLAE